MVEEAEFTLKVALLNRVFTNNSKTLHFIEKVIIIKVKAYKKTKTLNYD